MKAFLFFLLFATNAFADFKSDYQYFLTKDEKLTAAEISEAQQFNFVLIAGFLNELGSKDYFLNVQNHLSDLGIKSERIYPSSLKTAEDNSNWLAQQLEEKFITGERRPLITVGHSKGGQESIITSLDHPELILSGKVARVVTLQSAIAGNELFKNIPFGSLFSRYALIPQLRALNPEKLVHVISERLVKLAQHNPETYAQISKATHFIISSKTVDEIALSIRPSGYIISGRDQTPTDGLVATKHMFLQNFGTVLGELERVDHLDLVSKANDESEIRARAFTYALVRHSLNSMRGETQQYQQLTQKMKEKFSCDY